jgi:hypothetical protein
MSDDMHPSSQAATIIGSVLTGIIETVAIIWAFVAHGFVCGLLMLFIGGPIIWVVGQWVTMPVALLLHAIFARKE